MNCYLHPEIITPSRRPESQPCEVFLLVETRRYAGISDFHYNKADRQSLELW